MEPRSVDSLHNNPPSDGEILRENIAEKERDGVLRRDELVEGAEAFDADHATIDDDETSGLIAGVIKQLLGTAKDMDGRRIAAKEPFLLGTRVVDGFYKQLTDPLEKWAKKLNEKQTAYQRAKADRIRREAEEAARIARAAEDARRREAERAERERQKAEEARRRETERAEAERLRAEREAKKAGQDAEAAEAARQRAAAATLRAAEANQRAAAASVRADEARAAEETARVQREEAAKIAESNAADRSRTRGDYAMASLRTTWGYSVEDIALVPLQYHIVNDKVVSALIRGKDGVRDIPGLRIYAIEESVNR